MPHLSSITFPLNRHGPCERLRDSRSPDPQGLEQGLEVLALGRGLRGPAQLHDSRLRSAPLALAGEAQVPAQRREFHCRALAVSRDLQPVVAAPPTPAPPTSKESASTRTRPSGFAKAAAGSAGSSSAAGALASTFWRRRLPAPRLTLARSRVSGATPDSATPRRPVNIESGLQLHSRSAMPRKAPPERSASRPLPFHRVPAGSPSASAPRLERSSANPNHAAGAFIRRKTRYAAVPRTTSRTPGRRRAPVTRPAPATAAARSRCRDLRPFRASRFPRAVRSAAAARPATPSAPRTGRLRSASAPRSRLLRRRVSAARAGPAARLPARQPLQDWRAA